MVKKTLALLAVITFAGTAVWYVKSGRQDSAANLNNVPELASGNNEESSQSEPAAALALKKTYDLKALSLEIIERPITINVSLPEISKQQAVAKIKELSESIRQDYNNIYQWYDLGAYRQLIGDYEGAIAAWNFGIIIRPNDYIIYQNLGDLYAFYLKNYDKGEQNFLKSLEKNSKNVYGYQQLALLYETSNNSRKSENTLLLGIEENPDVPILKILLGKYYLQIGRKEEAIQYLEEALALSPDNQALREEIAALKNN